MKIKRSIALIIGVVLLLCTISACGSSGNTPVGEWYNDKGKCLEVKKDGSWKLEGSYGEGTWKELDDGTFEFTDFYGDTQESAINEDESGLYIDFGYYGAFYKDLQKNSGTAEKSAETASVAFNQINNFNNGVAWITYTSSDNTEMFCLIDTTGKKIYEDVYENTIFHDFNNDISYISQGENIVLIDINGKVITTSEKTKFDKVVGYGDGIFLVYQNQSTISENKHLYTAIDKNGKQLFSPVDLGCAPDDHATYAGCGIFIISGNSNEKILFNYETQKKTYIFTKTAAEYINFVNNNAYFSGNVYVSNTGNFPLSLTEGYYVLNTNFEVKEIEYFNYITDGITIQCNGYMLPSVEYVSITDRKTNEKFEIKQYPSSQVGTIDFNGEYGSIKIMGQDGKNYFSLIDRKANFQFEPIHCTSASFSDKYMTFRNEDKTWGIADKTGKILANNLNYTKISDFDNGIAIAANNTNENFYINEKGEKMQINLH